MGNSPATDFETGENKEFRLPPTFLSIWQGEPNTFGSHLNLSGDLGIIATSDATLFSWRLQVMAQSDYEGQIDVVGFDGSGETKT